MKKIIYNERDGFTMIELLVVISIIGLISVASIVALNGARAKARDARRYNDLKVIKKALDLYYFDHGAYPNSGFAYSNQTAFVDNLLTPLYNDGYILQEIVDPVNSGSMLYFYSKGSFCGSNAGYILGAYDLESEDYAGSINPRSSVPDCGSSYIFYNIITDYVIGQLE